MWARLVPLALGTDNLGSVVGPSLPYFILGGQLHPNGKREDCGRCYRRSETWLQLAHAPHPRIYKDVFLPPRSSCINFTVTTN